MIEKFVSTLQIEKFDFNAELVIFDIGSRDGLQSIEFSNTFKNSKVFAIEGNPDNITKLKENVKDHQRISYYESIVAEYDGDITFYKIDTLNTITDHPDGNPGASSLYLANHDYPLEKYVQIPIIEKCITLKSLAEKAGVSKIDLIWMDLQGAEIRALEGLHELINSVKYIYTEISHTEIYKNQPLFSEFEEYMNSKNFERISKIDSTTYFEDAIYRNRNYKTSSNSDIILNQPWGGLGDNLQFSTLPYQATRQGKRFFISRENAYRNDEIASLVWANNPYVSGISSSSPNAGSLVTDTTFYDPRKNTIENIENLHGFDNRNLNNPLVYFTPHNSGKVYSYIFDLSATGIGAGSMSNAQEFISFIFEKYKPKSDEVYQIKFSNIPNTTPDIENVKTIWCNSLEEYANILYFTKHFFTVHSGAHALSSGIKGMHGSMLETIHCCVPKSQFNLNNFIFDNVKYYVVNA